MQFASMQMHLQEKVISLRLIIIRNGEDMLLINFPLDKLSSVLADTGQIPDSLSHLGPFKEDVSSIVLIKKNMSPLLSIAFNHLISYQNSERCIFITGRDISCRRKHMTNYIYFPIV